MSSFKPMLVTPGSLRPDDERYAFEVKWDGFRAILATGSSGVIITSRNGHGMTSKYPELQALSSSRHRAPVQSEGGHT